MASFEAETGLGLFDGFGLVFRYGFHQWRRTKRFLIQTAQFAQDDLAICRRSFQRGAFFLSQLFRFLLTQ